ncbi:MAG TPA: hypothetical protein VK985_11695 [Rariglobus sp.]|nr:hypothetical protein [Rariglobus sp.]
MTTQELYELADREIRLGTHDRPLMAKAMSEAGGIEAVAHQKYWQFRADAIREQAKRYPDLSEELYLKEVRSRLDNEEGRRRLRANLTGWMWVIVCYAGFCGAAVFFWAAKSAVYRGSSAQYGYGISGIFCVVMAVVAYVITKKDAGQDPF